MSKCSDCNKEMLSPRTTTCTMNTIVIGGNNYRRNSTYFDINKKCHDCGIVNKRGNYHHFGCDIERCPICGNQLISCGCLDKGEVFIKSVLDD